MDETAARTAPEISVIVPLYNEAENVQHLYERLVAALEGLDFEVLLVDDGSTDGTRDLARQIVAADHRIRLVAFRRNYGQTPAMVAGIDNARGRILVTMDGDLQNDPRDIATLYAKVQEGYDIVVGWREKRQDALITRKIPSKIANWIIGRITGVPIKDNGCSLKAYRGDLIKRIPLYSEMHRFIPAMASLAGSRILEIPVRHHARQFGQSKYGLNRVYKVVLDLIVVRTLLGCAGRPVQFFGGVSLFPFAVGGVLAILAMLTTPGQFANPILLISSFLFISLGAFQIAWGFLAMLLRKTSQIHENQLARLTMRAYE